MLTIKKLENFLAILLLLTFNSCTTVPDVPVLTRLNATQGYYVFTISDKEGIVDDENLLNGKTWIDYVIESVYVPADSWKQIKSYILKNCKKNNDCNDNIGSWDKKLNTIDKTLKGE